MSIVLRRAQVWGSTRVASTLPQVLLVACLIGLAQPSPAQGQGGGPVDCEGPAPEAEPNTAEWFEREANSILCARQRHDDQALHPVTPLPLSGSVFGLAPMPLTDAYREPARNDDKRFRFDAATITNREGEALAAEIYRPCAPASCLELPDSLAALQPPYPAVVVLHGGGSRKELHWWSSQTLAEAGYMVISFDRAAGDFANAEDVLDWLLATPGEPTAAGEHNPFWQELDRERVGLAGHSMGGQSASVLGQLDPRVSAIVSWDRGTGLQLPDQLHTPTLFFVADYACQANPVCQPEPYLEPPQGEGPGERGREYEIVHAAGVDAMKIALRATTHLDWTLSEPSGNRYGEIVSVYYTLAWFDRYLSDDPGEAGEAFQRLTATSFDDSADRHNISQGLFDPALAAASPTDPYAGNVPYAIEGLPVADRLSFYFASKCFISAPPGAPGSRYSSDDMRAGGCPAVEGGPSRGRRAG
jgi:pimeloyl-ACP methyl ester carboxylesterase